MAFSDTQVECAHCLGHAYARQMLGHSPAISAAIEAENDEQSAAIPTATGLDAEGFADIVQRSGLVDSSQLRDTRDACSDGGYCDVIQLVRALVERRLLTAWQAEKLMQGRSQGFFIKNYRLLAALGPAPCHTAYLARHTVLGNLLTIKVAPAANANDGAFLQRWYCSASQQALLDHPSVPRLLDADHDGPVHYIVRAFVRGVDLAALRAKVGRFPPHLCAALAVQLAHATTHACNSGGCEVDCGLSNLVLSRDGLLVILNVKARSNYTPMPDADRGASAPYCEVLHQDLGLAEDDARYCSDAYLIGEFLESMLVRKPDDVRTQCFAEPDPIGDTSAPDALFSLLELSRAFKSKRRGSYHLGASSLARPLIEWLARFRDAKEDRSN